MFFETWDVTLFYLINREWTHPLLDSFFIFWTDFQKTASFYFLFLPFLLFYAYRKKAWSGCLLVVLAFAAMGIADQLNSHSIKPLFERPRPLYSTLPFSVTLRIPEVGGYGFPSSHAVDAFCLAGFLGIYFRKLFLPLALLATLTAYSRVYCGVHFPADVLAGAALGLALGWAFTSLKKPICYLVLLFFSFQSHGLKDPTHGQPFLPWLWEDQLRPTIRAAGEQSNLYILAGGGALTGMSFEYDDNAKEFASNLITVEQAQTGSLLGGGAPLIGVALIQIAVDQDAGLAHARAMMLTAASHISLAFITQRQRPNESPTRLSFPSGHASHTFASATSLAYSYGPWIGSLAYGAAIWNGLSRIREEAHWASDVVAGATLGIFWGRASAKAFDKQDSHLSWHPSILPGGGSLMFQYKF